MTKEGKWDRIKRARDAHTLWEADR